MRTNILFAAAAAAATLYLAACSGKDDSGACADYTLDGDTITVPAGSALNGRIASERVEAVEHTPVFSAPAEVRAVPALYAEVAVPFAGRIAASLATPGQKVAAGTPLFRISSADFMDVCRTAADARTEMEQASRALARTRRMHETKMASARELEEAEADYDIKSRAYANAAAALKVFGADASTVVPGQPLAVVSPIAGTVMSNTLVAGQYVKDDAEPAIVVADLSRVWVVANVRERDFALLAAGPANATVRVDALPDTAFEARVYHINDILDPATRTAEVILECDNRTGMLKPNMFATASLTGSAGREIVIPAAAIRRKDDKAYVMRALGGGRYEGVRVEIAEDADGTVVARSGLAEGDSIVTKGAFYLPEPKNI